MNLRSEFQEIQIKEPKIVNEFSKRLSKVVTQIRVLVDELKEISYGENISVSSREV